MRTGNRTDHYVKPSEEKQWHERADAPSIVNDMKKEEIEAHKRNLVAMYNCENSDITFRFERIKDENDEDRKDFIQLVYYLKCVIHNEPRVKEIFSIKVKIPDEIKNAANNINVAKSLPPPKLRKPAPRK